MKKLLLIATSVIAVTVTLLSIKNEPADLNRTGKESDEKGDALGMIDYFNKINSDPATGTINYNYYYDALKQAQTASAASRASGGVSLTWEFLGPDNIGGRTRAILFDKNNPSKVFAAGVSGGLWISNDGGHHWTEWGGSDTLANMCIVSLCQDIAGNIYFGTGEQLYDGGNLGIFGGGFPGDGMWMSSDDGVTFTHLASTIPNPQFSPSLTWAQVNRIAANPNSDTVIAATAGGLYLSSDNGTTWTQPKGTHPVTTYDVKFSADGKKVYAGCGGQFYYSANGGVSFTALSGKNGFPSANGIGRIEFGVSPTNPNYAYAALNNLAPGFGGDGSLSSVVQTTDGGATWTKIGTGTGAASPVFNPTGNQGVYDLAVAVSPQDPGTIFVGGTTLWRWNTGNGWQQISIYNVYEYYNSLHADLHALVFDPSNSSRMLIGCDGGVAQTLDPFNNNDLVGVLFSSLNVGYDVTQFYSVSADSEGRPIGGTQDNGNQAITGTGNSASFPPFHTVSYQSSNIILGGDGGCTTIALSNNQAYFGQTPYGNVLRSSNAGVGYNSFYDSLMNNAALSTVGGQFYTPFSLWEDQGTDSGSILVCNGNKTPQYPGTHKPITALFAVGLNGGQVWVTPAALDFGASPDWFKLQGVSGNVTATAFSRDGKYLYVGTDAGSIYRYSGFDLVFKKKNGWKYPEINNKIKYVWNAADSGIAVIQSKYGGFSGRTVLSFATDPNDTNHVAVTCGNYDGKLAYIAISHNAEDTGSNTSAFGFTSSQGTGSHTLPYAPVYSSCITHAMYQGYPYILVGTPMGVWVSTDDGTTWQPDNDGLANVVAMSVKELPYYGGYAIYAGTHGRGIFRTFTLTTGINALNKLEPVNNLNVFPNPLSGTGHIQYNVAQQGNIIINLYNIQGKLIKVIANEKMDVGPVDIQFNVSDLVSGTYIVDVIEGEKQATSKLVVLH